MDSIDKTFKRLARPSFEEIEIRMKLAIKDIKEEHRVIEVYQQVLEKNHWTEEEYTQAFTAKFDAVLKTIMDP